MSPVREAKSRLLSREYMADRLWMTANTAAEREWYLLTSTYADDAGYLPWDLIDNAANLYRYEVPAEREELVAGYVAHFTASGRFVDLGCGHALMPSVAKRPRGRKREYTVQDQHRLCTASAQVVHSVSTGRAQSGGARGPAQAVHSGADDVLSRPIPSSPIPSSPAQAGSSIDPARTNGAEAVIPAPKGYVAPRPAVVAETMADIRARLGGRGVTDARPERGGVPGHPARGGESSDGTVHAGSPEADAPAVRGGADAEAQPPPGPAPDPVTPAVDDALPWSIVEGAREVEEPDAP